MKKDTANKTKDMADKPKTGLAAIYDELSHIQPLKEKDLESSSSKSRLPSSDLFNLKNTSSYEKFSTIENVDESEKILKIDPHRICLSPNKKDRRENELGDLEELANTMKIGGQIQPCIVEVSEKDNDYDYVLIIGERRWRAAKLAGIKLDVVVRNTTKTKSFEQQIRENLQRQNLSNYALGMFCAEAIEDKRITRKELPELLSTTDVEVIRLLSFAAIPPEIVNAIGDMRLVSSRTAAEIRALAKKGDEYIAALIQLAPKIETGKLGERLLKREVQKIIHDVPTENSSIEVKSITGQHLFSWRKDSNNNDSISFPKDVRARIDKEKIQNVLKEEIEKMLLENKN